jgi:hypothetical protein
LETEIFSWVLGTKINQFNSEVLKSIEFTTP